MFLTLLSSHFGIAFMQRLHFIIDNLWLKFFVHAIAQALLRGHGLFKLQKRTSSWKNQVNSPHPEVCKISIMPRAGILAVVYVWFE